ncbi:MAG: TRAP transporter small permease subunit [Ferrovibrio sp.]
MTQPFLISELPPVFDGSWRVVRAAERGNHWHPQVRELLYYWMRNCTAEGHLPSRQSIDRIELSELLPRMWILDVERSPWRFRYRMAGAAFAASIGRTIGNDWYDELRPLAWAVNTSEFFLLYITFLAMPWLVRQKGHVFVEFLRIWLPRRAKAVLARIVYLGCIVLCLYLGWVAWNSLTLAVQRGTFEMRTFDIPKWVVFAPMVLAFFLSAVEWLRYLLGYDDFYDRDPLEAGGH